MIEASVTCTLPFPWKTTVRLPRGWSMASGGHGSVRIAVSDPTQRRKLEALAELLSRRTAGYFEIGGRRGLPVLEPDERELIHALASPYDARRDAKLVRDTLSSFRKKLGGLKDKWGFRSIADAKLRQIVRDGEGEERPAIKINTPATATEIFQVDRAFKKRLGVSMPHCLWSWLETCDGITPSWGPTFGSVNNIMMSLQDPWPVIALGADDEGPGLLVTQERVLVVDVWPQKLGHEDGSGWPVLDTCFGSWLARFLNAGLSTTRMESLFDDPQPLTPPLLEWTDRALVSFLADP